MPGEQLLPVGYSLMGPSTKPTTLNTGETISFTIEALESAAQQIQDGFVPNIVEHLHYLPPVGRVVDAQVVEIEGYSYLAVKSEAFNLGEIDDLTVATPSHDGTSGPLSVRLSFATEPRNFEQEDFTELRASAPIELGETSMHSALPPLIWTITIAIAPFIIFSAKAFSEAFFEALGAESGAAFVAWLNKASKRARQAERQQLFEFKFGTESGLAVFALCPFSVAGAGAVAELRNALDGIGEAAAFVYDGSFPQTMSTEARQVALLWHAGAWHLAWWASDSECFVTPWFRENAPNAKDFLGFEPAPLDPLLKSQSARFTAKPEDDMYG